MADIAAGASRISLQKYLAIANKDDVLTDISAFIEDTSESLPFNVESDKPGNEFWDKPIVTGGGMRTISCPVRKTPAMNTLMEGLIDAQATTGTPQYWDYEYGYEGNGTGKQKVSGKFLLGNTNWDAGNNSKQTGNLEMQIWSRNVGTF